MGRQNRKDISDSILASVEKGLVVTIFELNEMFGLSLQESQETLLELMGTRNDLSILYFSSVVSDTTIEFRLNRSGGEFFGISKAQVDIHEKDNYSKLGKYSVMDSEPSTGKVEITEKGVPKKAANQKSILSFFGKK